MNKVYKQCSRCVMDNASDNTIEFDQFGICNYCKKAETDLKNEYFPNSEGITRFNDLVDMLKKEGQGKKYDCLMGISGGLDSSYLLYIGAKAGLRILALHVNDGFNTELAGENIKNIIDKSNMDFVTINAEGPQFADLTKAYMKAGVCNLAVPQDNLLFANIYKHAINNNIKYFLSGSNLSLESILEYSHTYTAYDTVNIKDIHKKFGQKEINDLELLPYYKNMLMTKIYKTHTLRPLNYIDYNKDRAIQELYDWCGYQYYEAKHLENYLTKFTQLYWFYNKFGVDKRKSHLSSLIMSGQMSREDALNELSKPVYIEEDMQKTIEIIQKKLNISDQEFIKIMNSPAHSHYEYKTSKLYNLGKWLKQKLNK